jgi:hypothetical protein
VNRESSIYHHHHFDASESFSCDVVAKIIDARIPLIATIETWMIDFVDDDDFDPFDSIQPIFGTA